MCSSVKELGSSGHDERGEKGECRVEGGGTVAAVFALAGADEGVVLLQDGGVARPVLLVLDVATATDNPHVSAH